MRAVYRANLEAIREMSKWMEDVPEVKEEDIAPWSQGNRNFSKDNIDPVLEAIQKGKEQRKYIEAVFRIATIQSFDCIFVVNRSDSNDAAAAKQQ